jgi:uncharacterized membrane protein YcaP (DUF421 family)
MEKEIMELLDVILRSLVSLVSLFLVTKLIGKKQISQLSLFDYVIGISIGNFAAEMSINLESEYLHGIVAVVVFGLVAYLVSLLSLKNLKLRRFFMGDPTMLIQDGKIIHKGLKKARFAVNDLLEECRIKGYFDLKEIDYALMEANGDISFMPKIDYQNPKLKDLNIKKNKSGLCANIIIDGQIMHKSLEEMKKDVKWLNHELSVKGVKLENVLLATLDLQENFEVYEKNVNLEEYQILG